MTDSVVPSPQSIYLRIIHDSNFQATIQLPLQGYQKSTLRQAILPNYAEEINTYIKEQYEVSADFDLFTGMIVCDLADDDVGFSCSGEGRTRKRKILNGFDYLLWKERETFYLKLKGQLIKKPIPPQVENRNGRGWALW